MGRKIYLALSITMLSLLFLLVVFPYITVYIDYMNGLKSFSRGAYLEYSGKLYYDFFDDRNLIHITKHYKFYLNLSYYSDTIEAKLELYDDDTGEYLAGAATSITRDHELTRFLFPPASEFNIELLNLSVRICEEKGSIYFAIGALPTNIGVPPRHAALMNYNGFTFIDISWDEWGCAPINNGEPMFYTYVRIENGYMLISYISDLLVKEDDRDFVRLGPPLIKILAETFKVQILNETLSEITTYNIDEVDYIGESIRLESSNVFPVEQAWIEGISGTYMYLTPLSQILTVASLMLYALYLRRK